MDETEEQIITPITRCPYSISQKCQARKFENKPPIKKPEITIPPITRKVWRPDAWKNIPTSRRSDILNVGDTAYATKLWNHFKFIGPKTMILRGNYSYQSKRFGLMCAGKQSSAIAICLLAFKEIINVSQWISSDLDKILDEGTKLYKKTLTNSNYKRDLILKPNQIASKFFIDTNKIISLAGKDILKGYLKNLTLEEDLNIFLINYDYCIFYYDNKAFAIWKFENYYFIFNPMDVDRTGHLTLVNHGGACCLRVFSIKQIIDYLYIVFKVNLESYEIYSVNIWKMQKQNEKTILKRTESDTDLQCKDVKTKARPKTAPIFIQELFKPEFSDDFNLLSYSKGILRASSFTQNIAIIPSNNLAAIIMRRNFKVATWNNKIMNEILEIGFKIFNQSNENSNTIKIDEQYYKIDREQIVIGELTSKNSKICDLYSGVQEFFKIYDCGLLQGPQNVSIWQEGGLYYIFDSKERDETGQKFNRAKQFGVLSANEMHGKCCLIWFKNLLDLVTSYIQNVSLKHRNDPFRLTKIEVTEIQDISEDWNNWKGINTDVWIIRGKFSQNNKRFSDENRNKQASCISVMSIVFTEIENLLNWNKNTLENILNHGDTLYSNSIAYLKESDNYIAPLLKVTEIKSKYTFQDYKIEFRFDEPEIYGSVSNRIHSTNDINTLKDGLQKYFQNNQKGVLTACSISIGIWIDEKGFFYYFDSHPRDNEGKNPLIYKGKGYLGTCCAMRFACINKFSEQIYKNFELSTNILDYNIYPVEFFIIQNKYQPPFNHFVPFGLSGGVLRPIEIGLSEGNDSFDLRANRQTICNLIVALGMAQINRSIKWSENYINDILNIGDKWFCRIIDGLGSAVDDDFVLDWSNLGDHVEIGINNLKFVVSVLYNDILFEVPRKSATSTMSKITFAESLSTSKSLQSSTKLQSLISNALVSEISIRGSIRDSTKSRISRASDTYTGNLDLNNTNESRILSQNKSATDTRNLDLNNSNESRISSQNKSATATPKPSESLEKTRKSLESVMSELENLETFNLIIESQFLVVALWKQDNLYFIFDPKCLEYYENLINNHPEYISSKSEPFFSMHKEKNRSYVAWFTELQALVDHILKRIPHYIRSETLTLKNIEFQVSQLNRDKPAVIEKKMLCHNFQYIEEGHSLIRGTISQNDRIFNEFPNRNNQDTANCISALAFSLFCDPCDWSSTILDVIIKYGDRLYDKSLEFMKKINPNENYLNEPKIKLHNLATPFSISYMKFYINVIPILIEENINLKEILINFFQNYDHSVIMCRGYYVAIWKEISQISDEINNLFIYYTFDPHDVGPNGLKRINGSCCLSRFESIEAILKIFCKNCCCDGRIEEDIKIYHIKINMVQIPHKIRIADPEPDATDDGSENMDNELSHYTSFKKHFGSTKYVKGTKLLKNSSKSLMSYIVLSALVTTKALKTIYWTEATIDEIITMGDHLQSEKFIDLNNSNKTISFEFSEIEIQIKNTIEEKIDENLEILIDHFFEENNIGIFITEHVILGAWREDKFLYLFSPSYITNQTELIQSKSLNSFYKILLNIIGDCDSIIIKNCELQFKL